MALRELALLLAGYSTKESRYSHVPCLGTTIELALVAGASVSQTQEQEYGEAGPAVHLPGNGIGIVENLFSHLWWVGELALCL